MQKNITITKKKPNCIHWCGIFPEIGLLLSTVKSSAWSFGHADPDPSSVTEFPLKQDWNLYQFDSCFRVIIALRFNEVFSNISFYQIWEDGLEEHKYEFWQSFSRLYKSFFHIVHSTCFETSFFELKWY